MHVQDVALPVQNTYVVFICSKNTCWRILRVVLLCCLDCNETFHRSLFLSVIVIISCGLEEPPFPLTLFPTYRLGAEESF